MTKQQSVLEMTRREARDLHKLISANICNADHATWAERRTLKACAHALAAKTKTPAEDQAEAIKDGIKAAAAMLDAACKRADGAGVAAKDDAKHANTALLEAAHKAAQAIAPKMVVVRTPISPSCTPRLKRPMPLCARCGPWARTAR